MNNRHLPLYIRQWEEIPQASSKACCAGEGFPATIAWTAAYPLPPRNCGGQPSKISCAVAIGNQSRACCGWDSQRFRPSTIARAAASPSFGECIWHAAKAAETRIRPGNLSDLNIVCPPISCSFLTNISTLTFLKRSYGKSGIYLIIKKIIKSNKFKY